MDDTSRLSDEELAIWTELADQLGPLRHPRRALARPLAVAIGVFLLGLGLRWPVVGGLGFLTLSLGLATWVGSSALGRAIDDQLGGND